MGQTRPTPWRTPCASATSAAQQPGWLSDSNAAVWTSLTTRQPARITILPEAVSVIRALQRTRRAPTSAADPAAPVPGGGDIRRRLTRRIRPTVRRHRRGVFAAALRVARLARSWPPRWRRSAIRIHGPTDRAPAPVQERATLCHSRNTRSSAASPGSWASSNTSSARLLLARPWPIPYSLRNHYISDLGHTVCGPFTVPHGLPVEVCAHTDGRILHRRRRPDHPRGCLPTWPLAARRTRNGRNRAVGTGRPWEDRCWPRTRERQTLGFTCSARSTYPSGASPSCCSASLHDGPGQPWRLPVSCAQPWG
jgi:hypothetical protein